MKALFELVKETIQEWQNDKATRLAAALAYYTIFSIAPLLIVIIAIAGLVFGQAAVTGRIDEQIQGMVGREGADFIQEVLKNAYKPGEGIIATVIGLITLLFGAMGVFAQLKDALNTVWGVAPKPNRGILGFIKDNLLSFTMLLGIGFILLVSLVISAGLAALMTFVNGLLPGTEAILQIVNLVVSFLVIMGLFALIYKVLPDVDIEWRDVIIGAAITSLLFTIGKFAIGLYLGNSSISSTFGAAGSFAVILIWIYYSAQLLLLGAEFTQVYARKHGSYIKPSESAIAIDPTKAPSQTQNQKPIGRPKKTSASRGVSTAPQPVYATIDGTYAPNLSRELSKPAYVAPAVTPIIKTEPQPEDGSTKPMLGVVAGLLAVAGAAFGFLKAISSRDRN